MKTKYVFKYFFNKPLGGVNRRLVGISQTTHTAHDTKNVVVGGKHANLGSAGTLDGSIGQHQLESSIVNTREVARAGWLVLFGAKGERVQVDTGVWGASVVLPRLNEVKVGAFTLREAILAVELELGGNNWVLTPAVHVKSSLGKHEGAGIRKGRLLDAVEGWAVKGAGRCLPSGGASGSDIHCTGRLEETAGIDETGGTTDRGRASESVNGVGKSVEGISVVEWLGTKKLEQDVGSIKRRAVVDIGITLNDPDKLLDRVVEVELDLVGRRTNGLITSELKLFNEVLMGVLGHAPALIGVEEHVVDIERSGNQGLVVGSVELLVSVGGSDRANSPQALVDGANVEVDLDFVVLKSDQGKSKTGVTAEPELEGDVEGGLGESVTRSANLARSVGVARAVNISKLRVSDVSQLSGVADHLVITALLFGGHGELAPDMHPVTVLAVNALTTDLNLNLRNQLLTGEIKPAGINAMGRSLETLADFGKGHLKVSAVSQVTIAADSAGNTPAKVSLAVESLFDRLHGKVGVPLVRDLPEGNLRITGKINVLCAIGDELH